MTKATDVRNGIRARNYQRGREHSCPQHRRRWTEAEDAAVLARESSDRDLARQLGRSVQAIQVRRNRIRA